MKNKKIKVLSLFDGISCAQVALKSLGYEVEYYASEIDATAIEITQRNHPDTIQLGDIKNISWVADSTKNIYPPAIDLLIGGSPCQDLSIAKKNREGLAGTRSGLFYEYLRILKEAKPTYFILENVASMPKEARDEISKELGIEPIMINAGLVSAQNRKRLFWTNIPGVQLPEDRKIYLKDILEENVEEAYCVAMRGRYITKGSGKTEQRLELNETRKTNTLTTVEKDNLVYIGHINKSNGQANRIYAINGKSVALSAMSGGLGAKTGMYLTKDSVRVLTPIECERLQGLPDNYTSEKSANQRKKVLGNAFNTEVVKHILSYAKWN